MSTSAQLALYPFEIGPKRKGIILKVDSSLFMADTPFHDLDLRRAGYRYKVASLALFAGRLAACAPRSGGTQPFSLGATIPIIQSGMNSAQHRSTCMFLADPQGARAEPFALAQDRRSAGAPLEPPQLVEQRMVSKRVGSTARNQMHCPEVYSRVPRGHSQYPRTSCYCWTRRSRFQNPEIYPGQ